MQFLFSFPVEPIRDKSSDLLREEKYSEDDRDRTPKQYVANPSPANRALFGPVLLPESDPDQHDGKTQEPRTQSGKESAGSARPQSGSESQRETATNCCNRRKNRSQRCRDASGLFHRQPTLRASTTARRINSAEGNWSVLDPG
jgi:hypothetical protein